jgi:hypothetical protein
VVRHEERVDGDAVAEVVATTKSLAFETEALIKANRRLVPREHVQLELRDSHDARPADRRVEEHATDSPPSMACRNHHPQVCDMPARRMRVSREGEAPDDPIAVDGDEHSSVDVTTDRLQVAALVGDGPPGLRRQEPATRLPTDRRCERDELRRVRAFGVPDRDHATTIP